MSSKRKRKDSSTKLVPTNVVVYEHPECHDHLTARPGDEHQVRAARIFFFIYASFSRVRSQCTHAGGTRAPRRNQRMAAAPPWRHLHERIRSGDARRVPALPFRRIHGGAAGDRGGPERERERYVGAVLAAPGAAVIPRPSDPRHDGRLKRQHARRAPRCRCCYCRH